MAPSPVNMEDKAKYSSNYSTTSAVRLLTCVVTISLLLTNSGRFGRKAMLRSLKYEQYTVESMALTDDNNS